MTDKSLKTLRRLGIEVQDHPFDRGYFERYTGEPRPKRKGERRDGWDTCDADLRFEREGE